MYNSPSIYGTQDYIRPVPADALQICKDECTYRDLPCDEELHELFQHYMLQNGWVPPVDHVSGMELYMNIRSCVLVDLPM